MTSTLTTHASANYATMPRGKRILACILAIVLAVSMIPFAPATKAYADTYASSAGSKTVTRTVEFVYEGETTPFDSVQEQFTFTWGRGTNLTTFTREFPAREASSFWTEYPSTWTFDPATIPAKTVSAEAATDWTERVVIKNAVNPSAPTGTATVIFRDTSNNNAEIPGTKFVVNSVRTGMPIDTRFSGGAYDGKTINDVVQETIDNLSSTYELVSNGLDSITAYTANATYYVNMKKRADAVDPVTSVTVKFIDQYNNSIVFTDGYYAQINWPDYGRSFNGYRFDQITYNDGSGLNLVTDVQRKIDGLQGIGYVLVSNDFDAGGTFGPTHKEYTVVMKKPSIEDGTITPPANVVYNGSSQKPEPTVVVNGKTLVSGTDYIAIYPGEEWTLNSETIKPAGDTVNVGNKEVQIIGWGDYAGYRTSTYYQILPQTISASLSQTEFTYNGNVQRPTVSVTDADGRTVGNANYTVEWSNANSKDAGTYTVTVNAKEGGNYQGGARLTYTIKDAPAPAKTDLSKATVELEYETVEYDGYVHKPAVVSVKVNGQTVPASEYTVAYPDNNTATQSGTKTVTIAAKSGSAAYTGSTTKSYQIAKVPLSRVTAVIADQTYTGSAITPQGPGKDIAVTYKGNTNVTGYTVDGYNNNVNAYTYASKPGALENAGSGPVVKVTATSSSNFTGTAYFPFNIIRAEDPKIEINSPDITVTKPADVTYNAASQTPKPVVKDGSKTLVEGTDYTLSYSSDTTNAGNVIVTITGTGTYAGTRTTFYAITPAAITSVTAPDQAYNGQAKTPTPTVKAGNLTVPASGYDKTYSNNVNVGTATVTVTGKGNYGSSTSRTFQIVNPDTGNTTSQLSVTFKDSNGSNLSKWTPNPFGITTTAGTTLNASFKDNVQMMIADYANDYTMDTAEWDALVKANKHPQTNTNIDIVGTKKGGNSGGTTPTPATNKTVEVNVKADGSTWTASATAPTTSKLSASNLVSNVQKQVDANKAKGFTQISWGGWDTAKSGTFGAAKTSYTITMTKPAAAKTDLSKATVTVSPTSYTYDGKDKKPLVTVKVGSTTVPASDYTINWPKDVKNAGTKSVTVTAKSTSGNYKGTSPKATYKVNPAKVNKPSATNRTYNGKEQVGVPAGTNYNLTGTAKATKVGTYDVTASLKDKKNYTWSDGKTADVKLTWKISEAPVNTWVRVELWNADTNKIIAENNKYRTSTWNGTTAVKIDTQHDGTSLKAQVESILAAAKAEGWKVKSQAEWDAVVKAGTYPKGGTEASPKIVKITMTNPNASGNTPTPAPVTNKTVKVSIKKGGNDGGSASATGPTTSKISSSLVSSVQSQVDKAKAEGYTQIDWGGWDKAKSGTYGDAKTSYTITMTKPGGNTPTPAPTTQTSKVTVKFVDASGKELRGATIATGTVGTKLSNSGIVSHVTSDIAQLNNQGFVVTDSSAWDKAKGGNFPTKDATYTIKLAPKATPADTTRQTVTVIVDSPVSTFTKSASGPTTMKLSSTSLVSDVQAKVDQWKAAGYTTIDWGGWDKAKDGNFPAKDTTYTIKMTQPNSGGNGGNGGSTPTPVVGKQTTITVNVVTSAGASGKSSATHTVGSPVSETGLDQMVDSRVASYRAQGFTTIDWGGWDKAKNGTFPASNTTYTVRMSKPGGSNNNGGNNNGSNNNGSTPSSGVTRLGGGNALETMSKVVNSSFAAGSTDTVVIATNSGYWDALAASSLAGKYNAPVLLTDTYSLSPETLALIQRLGAKRAFICGGRGAVSDAVFNQVKAMCPNIKRLAGAGAVDTAIKIANEVGSARSDTCIIATSRGYWDALSASPYAYAKKAPIYLTTPDGTLTPETLTAIGQAGYSRAIIAGGKGSVSQASANALSRMGINTERKAGASAYETSGDFAQWSVDQGMSPNNLGVATASGYWDALTGGAVCGANNSVLVLADDGAWQNINGFIANHRSQISSAYIFGGKGAVGQKTYDAVNKLIAK